MDVAALREREPVRLHWRFATLSARAEAFLEAEREQLALWLVVALGGGIALWLMLPGPRAWAATMLLNAGVALGAGMFVQGRLGRAAAALFGVLVLGTGLIWLRSEWVAAPRLERTAIVSFTAEVERVEPLAARDSLRLLLKPQDAALPPRIRVNMSDEEVPQGLGAGATVRLRARLTPPMPMPLPGAHDFARDSWFAGIGALGRALGKVEVVRPSSGGGLRGLRDRLGATSRLNCPSRKARSQLRLRPETRVQSPRRMQRRCGDRAWRTCSRSAASTSRRRLARPFSSPCACSPCRSDWHSASTLCWSRRQSLLRPASAIRC